MKKLLLLAVGYAIAMPVCFAQDEELKMPGEKKLEHRIGVQVNGLIRQVFNFSNTANPVNNPYLLTYSVNLIKSGWGIRVGGGYNNKFVAENDGITETESTMNNWDARLGIQKMFQLSDKWTVGVGADGIYGNDYNKTESVTRAFDTSTVKSKTTIAYYGGGVMAWLRYNLTDRIAIGTEASFYQRFGDHKNDVEIVQRNNSVPGRPIVTTKSKQEHNLDEGVINLPVAIYLVIRF